MLRFPWDAVTLYPNRLKPCTSVPPRRTWWWWSGLSSCLYDPICILHIIDLSTHLLFNWNLLFGSQYIKSYTWTLLPHPTSSKSWWPLSRCWKMNYPSIPSSALWHHCCPVLFPISSRGTQRCASPQPKKSPQISKDAREWGDKIFDICSFDVIW